MDASSSLKRPATDDHDRAKRIKKTHESRSYDEPTQSETPISDSLSSLEMIPHEIFSEIVDYAPEAVPHLRVASRLLKFNVDNYAFRPTSLELVHNLEIRVVNCKEAFESLSISIAVMNEKSKLFELRLRLRQLLHGISNFTNYLSRVPDLFYNSVAYQCEFRQTKIDSPQFQSLSIILNNIINFLNDSMGKQFGTVYTTYDNTDSQDATYAYDKVADLLKGFRARSLSVRPQILNDNIYQFVTPELLDRIDRINGYIFINVEGCTLSNPYKLMIFLSAHVRRIVLEQYGADFAMLKTSFFGIPNNQCPKLFLDLFSNKLESLTIQNRSNHGFISLNGAEFLRENLPMLNKKINFSTPTDEQSDVLTRIDIRNGHRVIAHDYGEMPPNIYFCNNVTEHCWWDMVAYCLYPKRSLVAFSVVRHTMTVFSIAMTTLSVFLVVTSKSVTRLYSNMLGLLLCIWMSMDVMIQWIGDPALLFPQMCAYRRSPLIYIPLSAGLVLAILQSIVMLGLVNYIALYRHQIIVPLGSRFKFSVKAHIAFLTTLLVPYLALGAQFYNESIPAIPRYVKWLSQEFFDSAMLADRIDCFPLGTLYYGILAFDGHFAWIFIVAVAWHTLSMLGKVKQFSQKTQQLHRVLTISLIAQALTPVIFIILPVTMALVTHIIFINNYPDRMSHWIIMPFDLVMVAVSFHATAHCITLLATTPAFAAKLREMLPGFIPRSIKSLQLSTSVTASTAIS